MQIIGMGVPLYQEAIDMSMLALISTMGSKNKGNIMRKMEDVSKLIVNENKTQYLSLQHVTKKSQSENRK